jgi:hypothetical protein
MTTASPTNTQAIFIALTPLERKALERLSKLHAKFPANSEGFRPSSLGPSCAAAARRMEASGYVSVKRVAANYFRYSLTNEGKARANG